LKGLTPPKKRKKDDKAKMPLQKKTHLPLRGEVAEPCGDAHEEGVVRGEDGGRDFGVGLCMVVVSYVYM
jgi:hypothetical protein